MQYETKTQEERGRKKKRRQYTPGRMRYMINGADGTIHTKILNKSQLLIHKVEHTLLC